ncbi:MAG: 6,7-dimethyl-8-ribityllumazine synthase [Myxococcota bacterium]
MNTYPSQLDATGLRFAVVISRFNHLVSVRLLEGCTRELVARGAKPDAIDVAWVPGAYEIPHAARLLAKTGRYAAVITLGAVIRGETPHFEFVCRGVADGVREVMRDTSLPVSFGVLTTDDVEQAVARAGGAEGNKGEEAARAAIEMARLSPLLNEPPDAVDLAAADGGLTKGGGGLA